MNKFQTSTARCFDERCQFVRVCHEINFHPRGVHRMGWGHWFLHGWIWSYKICSERIVVWFVFSSSTWHAPPQKSKIFLALQKIKEPFSKALQRNFVKQVHPAWSRWWLARWVMKCLPTSPSISLQTKLNHDLHSDPHPVVIQATCFGTFLKATSAESHSERRP